MELFGVAQTRNGVFYLKCNCTTFGIKGGGVHFFPIVISTLSSDVGGQRCPDSVQNYCVLSVGQNQVQVRNPDTRIPSWLKISNFDCQTSHSKSGQNPDSAVRRRLIIIKSSRTSIPSLEQSIHGPGRPIERQCFNNINNWLIKKVLIERKYNHTWITCMC